QACALGARASSNSSLDHRRSDVPTAKNGFATRYSVNKSAKVVLVRRPVPAHARARVLQFSNRDMRINSSIFSMFAFAGQCLAKESADDHASRPHLGLLRNPRDRHRTARPWREGARST